MTVFLVARQSDDTVPYSRQTVQSKTIATSERKRVR